MGTPVATPGLVPVLSRASTVAVDPIAVHVVPRATSSVSVLATPVTNALLSIRTKMEYDSYYKSVYVKDLENINYFIQNRNEQFSDKEVERVIGRM